MKDANEIRSKLSEKGYDGLVYEDDGCACSLDNLFACGCLDVTDCRPAYLHSNGVYYTTKEEQNSSESGDCEVEHER